MNRRRFIAAAAGLGLMTAADLRAGALFSVVAGGRRRATSGGGSVARFYLPSTGTPDVSPAPDAWTSTSALERRPLNSVKGTSAMTTQTHATNFGNGSTYLFKQFVSAPLAAQTISGTVKGQVRGLASGSANISAVFGLRVVSNDGATVMATLRVMTNAGNYPMSNGALRNIYLPAAGTALTSYACAAGDRLVLEIGMTRSSSWGAANTPNSLSFGEDSGTDLPENQTETAAYNPWIEFSNPVLLQ